MGETIIKDVETGKEVHVNVRKIVYKFFKDLDEDDAKFGAYLSVDHIKEEMINIYPDIKPDSEITVVWFTKNE